LHHFRLPLAVYVSLLIVGEGVGQPTYGVH
jgi:hypothetical protein